MSFRQPLFLIGLIALGACTNGESSPIVGEWTPIHVNNCQAEGDTFRITRRDVTYHANKSVIKIMKVSKIVTTAPGLIDIDFQTRKYAPGPTEWLPTDTMRFAVNGDRASVLGTVRPDGSVQPIEEKDFTRLLTMKRCGGH